MPIKNVNTQLCILAAKQVTGYLCDGFLLQILGFLLSFCSGLLGPNKSFLGYKATLTHQHMSYLLSYKLNLRVE